MPPTQQLATGLAVALATALVAYGLYSHRRTKETKESAVRTETTVTALTVYPIKSCRGISLQSSAVSSKGLLYDRAYMIVDRAKENRFLTQRQYPQLACVSTDIDYARGVLTVYAEGVDERVSIDLNTHKSLPTLEGGEDNEEGNSIKVHIWGDICDARMMPYIASQWFRYCPIRSDPNQSSSVIIIATLRSFLQIESVALVRMDETFTRGTDDKYFSGGSTLFADGYPILITLEESLKVLNERMPFDKKKLKMDNFRPNIVVRDPDSGCVDKDNTVTRVLKLFRQGKQLVFSKSLRHRGKWGGEVFFGTNAVPLMAADGSSVEVSVGQSFSVTE